jgi:hypothetical protein
MHRSCSPEFSRGRWDSLFVQVIHRGLFAVLTGVTGGSKMEPVAQPRCRSVVLAGLVLSSAPCIFGEQTFALHFHFFPPLAMAAMAVAHLVGG